MRTEIRYQVEHAAQTTVFKDCYAIVRVERRFDDKGELQAVNREILGWHDDRARAQKTCDEFNAANGVAS